MSDEFNWSEVEADTVVENIAAVAVYFNPKGAVVIRQQGEYAVLEDQVVVLPARYLPALIEKLTQMQKDSAVSEQVS